MSTTFKEGNFKIIRLTLKQDYYVEMLDDKRTAINGWTIEQVIEDWFKRHSLHSRHATRDAHKIGNSEKVDDIEVI